MVPMLVLKFCLRMNSLTVGDSEGVVVGEVDGDAVGGLKIAYPLEGCIRKQAIEQPNVSPPVICNREHCQCQWSLGLLRPP